MRQLKNRSSPSRKIKRCRESCSTHSSNNKEANYPEQAPVLSSETDDSDPSVVAICASSSFDFDGRINHNTMKKEKTDADITKYARIQWLLLSPRSRTLFYILIPLCFSWLILSTIDRTFGGYQAPQPGSLPIQEFSVVINTYNRPVRLKDAVRHYADRCGKTFGVSHVYIVWCEEGKTPPHPESFFSLSHYSPEHRSEVIINAVPNSLNSRFLPIDNIDDAVFMVDDDIRVECRALRAAFDAWRANPKSMVGFYPRLLETPAKYFSWPTVYWRNELNVMLTKASFLHARYLGLYTSKNHPDAVKQYVDKYFNCEDIAMSMLVANITQAEDYSPARPIYVEGSVSDKGLLGGISTDTGHMARRAECVQQLSRIYESHGWPLPLADTFVLTESSWKRHAPGFFFQTRPSNFFEWFAIGQMF